MAWFVCLTFIHWIAIYPLDSVIQPLNNWGDAPVVQKLDNTLHRINHYITIQWIAWFVFVNTDPMDSDLSGGWRYPAFEQPGPDLYKTIFMSKKMQRNLSNIQKFMTFFSKWHS